MMTPPHDSSVVSRGGRIIHDQRILKPALHATRALTPLRTVARDTRYGKVRSLSLLLGPTRPSGKNVFGVPEAIERGLLERPGHALEPLICR